MRDLLEAEQLCAEIEAIDEHGKMQFGEAGSKASLLYLRAEGGGVDFASLVNGMGHCPGDIAIDCFYFLVIGMFGLADFHQSLQDSVVLHVFGHCFNICFACLGVSRF